METAEQLHKNSVGVTPHSSPGQVPMVHALDVGESMRAAGKAILLLVTICDVLPARENHGIALL